MGINDLWDLLKGGVPIEPKKLKKLFDEFRKSILPSSRNIVGGVDVSMEVFAAMMSPDVVEHLAVDFINNNDISHYIIRHFEALRRLFADCKVDLKFIFDGANHPLKEFTQAERRERGVKAKAELELFKKSNGTYSEHSLNKILKDLIAPTPAVFAAVRAWAMSCKIPCYSAPFEADWQLAYMFKKKEIDFVLSKDGDILVHGATVMTNLSLSKGEAVLYKFVDIQDMMSKKFSGKFDSWKGLDHDGQLLAIFSLCIFLGCDYCKRPHGIGKEYLLTNFIGFYSSNRIRREVILSAIENQGLWHNPDGKQNVSKGAIHEYAKSFKNALHQFCKLSVFDANGSLTLFSRLERSDSISKFLSDVGSSYNPSDLLDQILESANHNRSSSSNSMSNPYELKDMYTMKIYTKTGEDFESIDNNWHKGSPGARYGVDTFVNSDWHFRRRHSHDLVRFLEARGIFQRGKWDRLVILLQVSHVLDNIGNYNVLPNHVFVGVGKFIALDVLLPANAVNFIKDKTQLKSLINQKLPRIDSAYFDSIFKGRGGVRNRAKACLFGGCVCMDTIKVAHGVQLQHLGSQKHTIISVNVIASCKKTEYEVFLIFDEDSKTFVGAPYSRCSCFGGNYFCSHMVAVLLYLSIIQHDTKNDIEAIINYMPMEIKLFQTKCVAWELLFGNVEGLSIPSTQREKVAKMANKCREKLVDDAPDMEVTAGGGSAGGGSAYGGSSQSLFEQIKSVTEEDEILSDNCQELEDALRTDASCEIDVVRQAIEYSRERKCRAAEDSKGRDITMKNIDEFNEYVMHSRLPNGCTANKLEQLQVHERLHESFESGRLPKCMLSYYLAFFKDQRAEMIKAIESGDLVYFDKFPNALANLPAGWQILADRGFAFDATKYPNLNAHITPAFVKNQQAFAQETSEEMWRTCALRWGSETSYAFYTNVRSLQDVIPYHFFGQLQNIVDWAAGLRNFNNFLQVPSLIVAGGEYINDLKKGPETRKAKRYLDNKSSKNSKKGKK